MKTSMRSRKYHKRSISTAESYDKPKRARKKLTVSPTAAFVTLCFALSLIALFQGEFFSFHHVFTHHVQPEMKNIPKDPRSYPRMVRYDAKSTVTIRHVDASAPFVGSHVKSMSKKRRMDLINDSKEYEALDEYEVEGRDGCHLLHEWQTTSRPICNSIHEFATALPLLPNGEPRYKYLTNGYYRDVWAAIDDAGIFFVFKPMRYLHEYTYRNFDRMRRDAIAMDRLTGERFILNIYASCGTSGFFEFASGGDIEDALWPRRRRVRDSTENLSPMEKLHIATQAAMSVASVHNIDMEGQASIAHTDISPGQWIKAGDIFKLNDFNRARFLRYKDGKVCPFYVGNNAGKNRSPEEYAYEKETEKVDIYSLGNIFYMLLQEQWPFDDMKTEDAQEEVKNGNRPAIYEDIWNSTEPVNVALKHAMIRCHNQNSITRATAREIADYWRQTIEELDPGRLAEWGVAQIPLGA